MAMRQWPVLSTPWHEMIEKIREKSPSGSDVSMSGSLYTEILNTKHECKPLDYNIPSHHSVSNNLAFESSRLVFESVRPDFIIRPSLQLSSSGRKTSKGVGVGFLVAKPAHRL